MSDLTDIQAICATALVLVPTVCLTLIAIFGKPQPPRRPFQPPTWSSTRHDDNRSDQ